MKRRKKSDPIKHYDARARADLAAYLEGREPTIDAATVRGLLAEVKRLERDVAALRSVQASRKATAALKVDLAKRRAQARAMETDPIALEGSRSR